MYDKIDASKLALTEKLVSLSRVSKTVKGGRKEVIRTYRCRQR